LEFVYDHHSRRIGKKVWDNREGTGNPADDHKFVFDGWNLIAILNYQSSIGQSFMWGSDLSETMQGAGGVGGLLAMNDAVDGRILFATTAMGMWWRWCRRITGA